MFTNSLDAALAMVDKLSNETQTMLGKSIWISVGWGPDSQLI